MKCSSRVCLYLYWQVVGAGYWYEVSRARTRRTRGLKRVTESAPSFGTLCDYDLAFFRSKGKSVKVKEEREGVLSIVTDARLRG